MKINFDKRKIAEATVGIVQKTLDSGKKWQLILKRM